MASETEARYGGIHLKLQHSGNGGRRIELEASLGYIPRNLFGSVGKI